MISNLCAEQRKIENIMPRLALFTYVAKIKMARRGWLFYIVTKWCFPMFCFGFSASNIRDFILRRSWGYFSRRTWIYLGKCHNATGPISVFSVLLMYLQSVSVCSVSSCHSRQTMRWWWDQISVWSTGCCANTNLTGFLQLMAKLMFEM